MFCRILGGSDYIAVSTQPQTNKFEFGHIIVNQTPTVPERRKLERKVLKDVKAKPPCNVSVFRQDHKEQLVMIECECGAKILLLPDIREMNRAVEDHIVKHKQLEKHFKKAEIAAQRIRQTLTEEIIRKAATPR